MYSLLPIFLFICILIPNAIAAQVTYPWCKKACARIADYNVKHLAPAIFSLIGKYANFHFWKYNKSKEQLPEQFIVISNHQSLLDIPLYMTFFKEKQTRFVAKDALGRHVPLVSEILRVQKHCLVPRTARPMEAIKYMTRFGKRVKENNQIPIIFPEGTRTKTGELGKFHSAGFRTLVESTKLPVAICALEGGFQLRDVKACRKNLHNGCYRVKVLKVCPNPSTKEECAALLEEAKVLIQAQVDEWRKLPNDQK